MTIEDVIRHPSLRPFKIGAIRELLILSRILPDIATTARQIKSKESTATLQKGDALVDVKALSHDTGIAPASIINFLYKWERQRLITRQEHAAVGLWHISFDRWRELASIAEEVDRLCRASTEEAA